MRRLAAVSLMIGAVLFGPAIMAQDRPPPVPVEAWSLERVAHLGREIYRHDIAAWVATDVVLAFADGAPPPDMRGWIVTPQGDDLLVRFVREDGETVRAGLDVLVTDGVAGPVTDASEGVLSAEEHAQFRARQTAIANLGELRCTASMNTIVLPDPDSDGWLVWLLAATTEWGVIPVGGHYRFRISADGETLLMRDQLSNGCLNLRPPPAQDDSTVGVFVTHMVSETPVETHVFLSLLNGVMLYVMTEDKLFAVAGDTITMSDLPPDL